MRPPLTPAHTQPSPPHQLQLRANLPPGVDGWGMSLKGMMSMVVGFGLIITVIFWWLNRAVVPRVQVRSGLLVPRAPRSVWGRLPAPAPPPTPIALNAPLDSPTPLTLPPSPSPTQPQGAIPKREKKKKEPMSVGESFTFLAKSPYIRDLAFLVVAYGISINLVEVGGCCACAPDSCCTGTWSFSICRCAVGGGMRASRGARPGAPRRPGAPL